MDPGIEKRLNEYKRQADQLRADLDRALNKSTIVDQDLRHIRARADDLIIEGKDIAFDAGWDPSLFQEFS